MYRVRIRLCALLVTACVAGCGEPAIEGGCAAECPPNLVCEPQSGTCVPDGAPEGGCASDAHCVAPTWRCDLEAQRCVQCLAPEDCESRVCQQGACLPPPDRCGVAQRVELSAEPTVIRGTTVGRSNDTVTSCAVGVGAPDLVYELVVPTASRLLARATPTPGSQLFPVLELRSRCGSLEEADRLACAWAWMEDDPAELSLEVAAGHYFLWLDADSGSTGEFELELVAAPPTHGDSCLAPKRLEPEGGVAAVDGDTRPLQDDGAGLCGGEGAADEVYRLELTEPRRVQIAVTATSPNFRPVLYLRRPDRCRSTSGAVQLACGVAGPQAAVVTADLPRLEAGSYNLFVDGALGADLLPTSGSYHLEVRTLPPLALAANDTCEGAQPITLPEAGTIKVQGDTSLALSDAVSACGGMGPDVVYRFSLPTERAVLIRAVPELPGALVPVLTLRTACDSPAPEDLVACSAAGQLGESASLLQGRLPARTYFLWVDGGGQSRGKFTLELSTVASLPRPANDACDAPARLQPGTSPLTLSGTTLGAGDDHDGCEFPDGAPSPDVAYELVLGARASVDVDVQAGSGSALRPVLSLNEGVCAAPTKADRLFCAWGDPGAPQRVARSFGALEPGSYFLWVDGDLTTAGDFTLTASAGAPVAAPANEDCASAAALLASGGPTVGDTRSARDSTRGHCQPWLTGSGEGGGDVAYTFTVDSPRTVTVTVTPDPVEGALFQPVVYVRGAGAQACGALDPAAQLACVVAPAHGSAVTLSLPNLAAGTYAVWVDGAAQTAGKFSLALQ